MEKEQSQNNPKNISEKEEELKESAKQTSEKSQTDELVADGLSQNPSEETKEEDKSPVERILELEDNCETIKNARIAIGGVDEKIIRLDKIENKLTG